MCGTAWAHVVMECGWAVGLGMVHGSVLQWLPPPSTPTVWPPCLCCWCPLYQQPARGACSASSSGCVLHPWQCNAVQPCSSDIAVQHFGCVSRCFKVRGKIASDAFTGIQFGSRVRQRRWNHVMQWLARQGPTNPGQHDHAPWQGTCGRTADQCLARSLHTTASNQVNRSEAAADKPKGMHGAYTDGAIQLCTGAECDHPLKDCCTCSNDSCSRCSASRASRLPSSPAPSPREAPMPSPPLPVL